MSNGLPGLRLSRQLWPSTNRGRRNKFGRTKQLARQAVNKEHQRRALVEISPVLSNEEHHADSVLSANSPINSSYRQFEEGTSKQQDDHHSSLKRILVKDQSEEVVEISDSESCPTGFEKLSGNNSGVNFGKLIEQECCHLKSKEDVNVWVNGVIGTLAKEMGLSSTMGDQAVKSFFLRLGYAKLNERKNRELNEDERGVKNYELCNDELEGDKLLHS
ncbi:hypothetical protein FRX31_016572 [Thalictrum thalictroides]|uniref:Uncharacterized protein n=1 Tax=Thalictrum thalictroides TaxID=46969 RepID=A0A7J6WAD8_THATH|nr:hypothetical protein FRX31_016572 [Thalictrum thalictroides]